VSDRDNDLQDIARRVAGAARSGEQVEAYVVRTQETDVEVFGGEVESLTTAGVEGIGVRVIGRRGDLARRARQRSVRRSR